LDWSIIMNRKNPCLLLACVAVAAVSLTACGAPASTYTSSDGKVQVTTSGDKFTATTSGSDGGTASWSGGGSAKYPANLPFPQYPSSAIQFAMDTKGANQGSSETVTLTSADAVDKVSGFYKSWFQSNGWKIDSEISSAESGSMMIASKDQENVTVMLNTAPKSGGGGNETTISISMQAK
jgi:hypothetical protein